MSPLCNNFINVLSGKSFYYNHLNEEMTAIFANFHDAWSILCMWKRWGCTKGKFVILKMTVQKTKNKNCWEGTYDFAKVYIGPKIRSLKEIKIK